jgi:hypothetical protein
MKFALRRVISAAAAAAFASSLVVGVGSASAGAAKTQRAAAENIPLTELIAVRRDHGLPADARTVTQLLSRHTAGDPAVRMVGDLIATDVEFVDGDDMDNDGEAIARRARSLAASMPDTFAGVYIDRQAGRVVVAVTGEQRSWLTALGVSEIDTSRLVIRQVRFSYRALEAAQRRIDDEHRTFLARGLTISATKLDEQRNAVFVGVPAAQRASARDAIDRLVPDPAMVVIDSVETSTRGVSGLNAPPLKGGQGIISTDGVTIQVPCGVAS